MTPERLAQLKQGVDAWYVGDSGTQHFEVAFNAQSNTLTFKYTQEVKRNPNQEEWDLKGEAEFSADVTPRLISFRREKPYWRKSDAHGTVNGETLKGVDFDGDAYTLPYHGELLPDFAIGFAVLAMDWSRAEKFNLITLDVEAQDVLPPIAGIPHLTPPSERSVKIENIQYNLDEKGALTALSKTTGKKHRWTLAKTPPTPSPETKEPEQVDDAITNAAVSSVLKNPPATGQMIQNANEHAFKVGVRPGDLLTKYEGTPLDSLDALTKAIAAASKAGKKTAEIELLRDGKAMTLQIPEGKIGIGPLTVVKGVETNLDNAMFGPMGYGPGPRPTPTKYEKLAREKCGSQVPWSSDYAAALAQAKEQHKVLLWWATPIHGSSIYRIDIFDDFLNVGLFTDPEVVAFVNTNFVTFKGPLTRKQMDEFHVDFLNAPAFLFVGSDGKLMHYLDGLTMIQKDFFLGEFNVVLANSPGFVANTVEPSPFEKAAQLARSGNWKDGAELLSKRVDAGADAKDFSPLTDLAWLYFRSADFDRALSTLKSMPTVATADSRAVERLYVNGAIMLFMNKDDEARAFWQQAADKDPNDPWAWRSAAEMENIGPLSRGVESPFWIPDGVIPKDVTLATLPHTTRGVAPEADVKTAARIGVEYLLEHQSANGGWNDTNYDFGGLRAMPNVRTAVTAICAEALLAHRDLEPARIDAALNRAFVYLTDPKHLTLDDKNEIIWPHIYRLNFYAAWLPTCSAEMKPKLLQEMKTIADGLTKNHLGKTGFYRHEYENDFVTGSVLLSLKLVKDAGSPVDTAAIAKSLDALERLRSPRGTFPYAPEPGTGPEPWKGSAGRTINCDAALLAWGRGSADQLREAIEKYIQFNFVQERVRKQTFHSDAYRIGGFFYWYNQHVLSQVITLTDPATAKKAAAFMRDMVLATREADGTWVDSIELGKTYATGMALLVLEAAKRFGK